MLLQSIQDSDYDAYTKLTDPSLSAFEPETVKTLTVIKTKHILQQGQLVKGHEFQRFYFENGMRKYFLHQIKYFHFLRTHFDKRRPLKLL